MTEQTRCGYVAIVGRPNVGKSTLLNRLLSRKLSITSRKPHTTRQSILGIHTQDSIQTIYLDTPGLQKSPKQLLHRMMNTAITHAIAKVSLVIMIVEPRWRLEDQQVLDQIKHSTVPVFLLINKIDRIKKAELPPYILAASERFPFEMILPISAKTGDRIPSLVQSIHSYIPPSPFHFPADQVTTHDHQFMAAEVIREKLIRLLGQEIPYALTVTLLVFEDTDLITRISAIIWVEKKSQKGIVIGKNGEKLKTVGTMARLDLERRFRKKVFLQLWVKINANILNDPQYFAQS